MGGKETKFCTSNREQKTKKKKERENKKSRPVGVLFEIKRKKGRKKQIQNSVLQR